MSVDGTLMPLVNLISVWKSGLGAFMGSHVSKSCKHSSSIQGAQTNRTVLSAGAIAGGLLAAGAIYSAMICM